MSRSASSSPSESRTRVPFALIWIPAPTSASLVDCSYTSTSRPHFRSASAAARPPMPPPMTAIVFGVAIVASECLPQSTRLRTGELDHLGPLLGFLGDQL